MVTFVPYDCRIKQVKGFKEMDIFSAFFTKETKLWRHHYSPVHQDSSEKESILKEIRSFFLK